MKVLVPRRIWIQVREAYFRVLDWRDSFRTRDERTVAYEADSGRANSDLGPDEIRLREGRELIRMVPEARSRFDQFCHASLRAAGSSAYWPHCGFGRTSARCPAHDARQRSARVWSRIE